MRRMPCITLTICSLLACRQESPEAQVKAAFTRCVAALEKGDAGAAGAALAPDFQGPEGMDRAAARLYLMGLLRREKVGVTVLANRVQIQHSEATQAVDLVITSKGTGLVPEEMGRHSYLIRWQASKNGWRIRSVEEASHP